MPDYSTIELLLKAVLPLVPGAAAFFWKGTGKRYAGKLLFIGATLSVALSVLHLKGLQKGMDLAGGAEIHYRIKAQRAEEERAELQEQLDALNDPDYIAKLEAERDGIQTRLDKEKDLTDDERIELEQTVRELEARLDRKLLEEKLAALGKKFDPEVVVGVLQRRVDPATLLSARISMIRTANEVGILVQVPYRPPDVPGKLNPRGVQELCGKLGAELERKGGESEAAWLARELAQADKLLAKETSTESRKGLHQLTNELRAQIARAQFEEELAEVKYRISTQGVLHFHIVSKDTERLGTAVERLKRCLPPSRHFIIALPQKDFEELRTRCREKDIPFPPDRIIRIAEEPEVTPRETSKTLQRDGPKYTQPLLLEARYELDGSIIDHASVSVGTEGPEVLLDLTPVGSRKFAKVTGEHQGEQLAIVLDDVLQSAPVIRTRITGRASITGDFTQTEARDLAQVLAAGSLPIKVEAESEYVIGPSLGRDSIAQGMRAVVAGAALIFFIMLVYYLSAGVVADMALALNLVLLLGGMALVRAYLTLPGIAGILLTIGMAVDANILIFERIREEKERGRSLRQAVEAGFDRAFVTIVDSNLTTILTALMLYKFGVGPIKGFAITLIFGILFNLFTSLYVSRTLIGFAVSAGWMSELKMLRLIGRPKIDFMRLRPFFATLSLLVFLGATVGMFLYEDKYGLDFTGGTMFQVRFREPTRDDWVRAQCEAATEELGRALSEKVKAEDPEATGVNFGRPRVQAFDLGLLRVPGSAAAQQEGGKTAEPEGGGESGESRARRSRQYTVTTDIGAVKGGKSELVEKAGGVEVARRTYRELLTKYFGDKLDPEDPFPTTNSVGRTVARELESAAFTSFLFSVVLVFFYILFRFDFNVGFGAGAIIALIHDVAIAAGVALLIDYLGLAEVKLDLPAVGALLTIVGYSLNDTIVIYDRIRENRRSAGSKADFRKVTNDAVNQTLSRTLLTSFTTLIVALALLLFAGSTVRGFAIILLAGFTAGTYSSIFVATSFVVWWTERQNRRLAAAKAH